MYVCVRVRARSPAITMYNKYVNFNALRLAMCDVMSNTSTLVLAVEKHFLHNLWSLLY